MVILVDGHNLIPHVPGMDLAQDDDEQALLERLQVFCTRRKARLEVYFDNAAPGRAGVKRFGSKRVYFVRGSQAADEAILARLRKGGAAARNWVVVTSDRRIQADARSMHVKVVSSEEFSCQLAEVLQSAQGDDRDAPNIREEDVVSWLKEFGDQP